MGKAKAPAEVQEQEKTAGEKLRLAREDAGLSIDDVASKTHIARRHLENLEEGNYDDLPGKTYILGFARNFAKAAGADQDAIVGQIREELAFHSQEDGGSAATFEPGDPARVPSRRLAWYSVGAFVILLIGALTFSRSYFVPGSGPASILPQIEQSAQNNARGSGDGETAGQGGAQANGSGPDAQGRAAAAVDPSGSVTFTALSDGVWVRFYEAEGERLAEKQMNKGEKYTIPAGAKAPQIWTGQPEALAVSIGGKAIGNLSEKSGIARDVSARAADLAARIKANRGADSQTGGAQSGGAQRSGAQTSGTQTRSTQTSGTQSGTRQSGQTQTGD